MTLKTAIGLMSGTSMDGIDAALIHSDGEAKVETGANAFFPYDAKTKDLIKQSLEDAKVLTTREQRVGVMGEVEALITKLHVDAVQSFLSQINKKHSEIDVLGFHGQTVLHRPHEALTVQLGDGKLLAQAIGIDVVYDMRENDMVHGGQGAPLIPIYHQALSHGFKSETPVVFVNIGGISNITYVGEELIAFDTGPGNALIDQWVQANAGVPYDDGGSIAAKGSVDMSLADEYLANAYFAKPLPKSLDRNDFLPPQSGRIGLENGARTLAYVTAAAILKSVDHMPETPKLWVIAGGGRHNPHIMSDLKELAKKQDAQVFRSENFGRDGDAMEAEAWGYLAIRSLKKLPLTFPKTTGVSKPISGGILCMAN